MPAIQTWSSTSNNMIGHLFHAMLAALIGSGAVTLMRPHQDTLNFMQTLNEVNRGAAAYLQENCGAPGFINPVTDAQLQTEGSLGAGFDNLGATFTYRFNPGVTLTVDDGNPAFRSWIAGREAGELQADASYRFTPGIDPGMYRATSPLRQLLAFDRASFDC